jgi:hypothetical protein
MAEFESLLLSIAIEGPVAFLAVYVMRWPCRGPWAAAVAAVLATAATHPQFWTASLWLYPRLGYWPSIGIAEGIVMIVEAVIIAWSIRLAPSRALIVSAVANTASACTGIGLSALATVPA